MTDLAAHGIEVSLPAGWEGRVFKRPSAGDVAGYSATAWALAGTATVRL